MISNCGKDENGRYAGGQAGDQTGAEYRLISWYNRPWNCVIRHPDAAVRKEIAKLATAAAQNDRIGYDQGERMTFWNQLQRVGYDPGSITVPCEADCSSSTMAIVKAAGIRLGNTRLQSVNAGLTTHSMRNALKSVGFDVLTDNMYVKNDACLLAGDILLNDSAHAAINVTDGAYANTSYGSSSSPVMPSNPSTVPGNTGSVQTGTSTPSAAQSLQNGDLVAIRQGAVWWSGSTVPAWVLSMNWYVLSVNGARVVLGRSEDKKYNVTSPIDGKYLTLVSGTGTAASQTAPASSAQTPITAENTYTVQSGDSLWSIAAKYLGSGTRWTEIQKLNGLKNSVIRPGQTLKLPVKE